MAWHPTSNRNMNISNCVRTVQKSCSEGAVKPDLGPSKYILQANPCIKSQLARWSCIKMPAKFSGDKEREMTKPSGYALFLARHSMLTLHRLQGQYAKSCGLHRHQFSFRQEYDHRSTKSFTARLVVEWHLFPQQILHSCAILFPKRQPATKGKQPNTEITQLANNGKMTQ